ncbi:MAG: hypothetical protein R3D60_09865 [Paracoccaceae bacterium]
MTLARAALLAVVLALPAQAQVAVGTLLSVTSGDWNGDEYEDAAMLIQAEDGLADLIVYWGSFQGMRADFTLPSVVFAGPMAGQTPQLRRRSDSAFDILTEQTGVGRTPWSQAITVAYRGGSLMVAGFDHGFYDRLDLSHYGNCSVNLLTNRFSLTVAPGDGAPERHDEGVTEASSFPLRDLTESFMPTICADLWQ